jgi:uncharacterized membrane protein YbhN (UPF0104 family)
MDAAAKLGELLQADIKRFDVESRGHKQIHRRTQVSLIFLTAAITVTAGLGLLFSGHEREIQFLVLLLSAAATATTAWSESRRARDLWQHEREVYYALVDIRRELDFRSSIETLALDEIEKLYKRAAAVLGSSTAKWSRILEKKDGKPSETKPGDV